MDVTIDDPLVGQLLDRRYQVRHRLARGGMGVVYEALDTRLDRSVALKVMHPGLAADEEFVARFIREAKATARLSHPNVVAVYDQGSEGPHVFLAMEHVQGRTLRDLLRERSSLTPREAFDVLEPVLAALGAAHRAGIVHRDVKPENVLLSDDGRVKVADFGLARAVSTSTSIATTQGLLIGTVAYLSPEQVERGVCGPRSDVYAAGILLFEMLTGAKPFDGESPIQVAYQHVHDDVPAPSSLAPGLPAELDALVARATSRDPAGRPADANQLLADVVVVRHALPDDALDRRPGSRPVAQPTGPDPAVSARSATSGGSTRVQVDETLVVPVSAATALGGVPVLEPNAVVPPPPVARQSGRRGPALLLAALLLLAVGAVAGTWWWTTAGPGAYTAAPSLVGLAEDEATTKAQGLGFGVEVLPAEFSEAVPAGEIISADPGAGERVREEGTIELVPSRGKERYAVPVVTGRGQDEASATLEGTNLAVGEVTSEYSDTVPEGDVVSSTPGAGAELRRGEPVSLVVSRGVEPVDVPDVVGAEVSAAVAAVEDARLVASTTEEFSEDVPLGEVISQQPAGGTAPKGSTVELVISQGPPLVTVPDVDGQHVDDAVRELEALGLRVRILNLPGGPNEVLDQGPNPGERVPMGSRVSLSVF